MKTDDDKKKGHRASRNTHFPAVSRPLQPLANGIKGRRRTTLTVRMKRCKALICFAAAAFPCHGQLLVRVANIAKLACRVCSFLGLMLPLYVLACRRLNALI